MTSISLQIPTISCGHCAVTIVNALKPLDGMRSIRVDVGERRANVDFDERELSLVRIVDALDEAGYPPVSVDGVAETEAEQPASAIDPVCGMEVDTATARFTSDFEGEPVHFCSGGCKKAFDAAPGDYFVSQDAEASSGCSCCAPNLVPISDIEPAA